MGMLQAEDEPTMPPRQPITPGYLQGLLEGQPVLSVDLTSLLTLPMCVQRESQPAEPGTRGRTTQLSRAAPGGT